MSRIILPFPYILWFFFLVKLLYYLLGSEYKTRKYITLKFLWTQSFAGLKTLVTFIRSWLGGSVQLFTNYFNLIYRGVICLLSLGMWINLSSIILPLRFVLLIGFDGMSTVLVLEPFVVLFVFKSCTNWFIITGMLHQIFMYSNKVIHQAG